MTRPKPGLGLRVHDRPLVFWQIKPVTFKLPINFLWQGVLVWNFLGIVLQLFKCADFRRNCTKALRSPLPF